MRAVDPRFLTLTVLLTIWAGTGRAEHVQAEAPASSAADSVKTTILERAGVARAGEYLAFGVPIPKRWDLTDAGRLRLRDGQDVLIPADFKILARWGGPPHDKALPAKWVLVGTLTSVPIGGKSVVVLDSAGPGPKPKTGVSIARLAPRNMLVDTGAAQFELLTTEGFNLIQQVTLGGEKLLEPLSVKEAIQYVPAGDLSVAQGERTKLRARKTFAVVERDGDLCKVVRVGGSIFDGASRPVLDFTARLHFVAGRSDVRLDFTVENNHELLADGNGQPVNAHKQGSANSVYLGGLRLRLRLKDGGRPLRVHTEQDVMVTRPKGPVRLYQDSSGAEHWNAYVGRVGWDEHKALAHPRLQSYCTKKGFDISGPGLSSPKSGLQALGWMAVRRGDAGPGLTVAVRDFWQNFPKALEAEPDGTLSVDLFPNGRQFRHNLRVGEEKTHTILLDFGTGKTAPQAPEQRAKAFNAPLVGLPPSGWCVAAGALGEVPPADLSRWPLYERYVRIALEPNPDFNPHKDDPNYGNRTLRQVMERYNLFGWQDYGDVPLDFEAFGPNQAGQYNLKYWYVYGMYLQFCRSGDPRWLDLAQPAARHLADMDILHIPDQGPQHWVHGAYFGHSEHGEPGNVNPNRNANSPSVDLAFGVPDLLLAYYLTGEERFREVALECPESMVRMMEFSELGHPIFQRDRANVIFGFLEAYRATGNKRWLEAMRKVVAATTDLSNKQWVTNPSAYGKAHPGEFISMFSFSQVVWTLGRYVAFCQEYGLKDDLKAAEAIQAYADFLLKFAKKDYAPGRATTMNEFHPDGGGTDTYLEINDWALLMADVLAYAYKHSGQKRYLEEAAKFYATGTIDPAWKDDPPVYLASKDLVNALNWGLVYMNQALRATSGRARD